MRESLGKAALLLCLAVSTPAMAAYDANGVALGADEKAIKTSFPSVHCKALEWVSRAADRRCDDARVSVGGVEARITFYLLGNVVQAFDVRFETKEVDRLAAFLKARYGRPAAEAKETVERKGKPPREIYKVRWEQGAERAVLTAQLERRRSTLTVSRGNFEDEIYRVR
jgi:hypothetical protein